MPTYKTARGRFIVMNHETWASGGKIGMDMKVHFAPNPLAWDSYVAMIQVVRCLKGPSLDALAEDYYMQGGGPEEWMVSGNRWHVDAKGRRVPAFGIHLADSDMIGSADAQWAKCTGDAFSASELKGALGWSSMPPKYALLHDRPQRTPLNNEVFRHEFEIVAVTVTGHAKGYRLGALRWGYQQVGQLAEEIPITAHDDASEDWIAACRCWNGRGGRLKVPGV